MKTSLEKKRLFLDMQEHPESYSDEQLEAMMADLDRQPDAEAVWERVKAESEKCEKNNTAAANASFSILRSSLQRYAAAFLLAAFLGVLSFAGYRVVCGSHGTATNPVEVDSSAVKKSRFVFEVNNGDTIFRFEDVRLDSILAIVAGHYHRQVVFRDKASQGLRLHMTCHTTQTLDDFLDMMNMFDGIKIRQDFDTLFVDSEKKKEKVR